MVEMADVHTAWYRAQDALKSMDSLLGQVLGVADESDEFSRVLRAFCGRADGLLRAATDKVADKNLLSEQAQP